MTEARHLFNVSSIAIQGTSWPGKFLKTTGGVRIKELLETALAKAKSLGLNVNSNVLVDSGCENVNEVVIEGLVKSEPISMTIAQFDIEQSNPMVETLFHSMKYFYLKKIVLSNFESLVKGADFYLHESNNHIPHSALKRATPEEVITGKRTEDRGQRTEDRRQNN